MDLIRELGVITFASRLRRLSDRLKAEATQIYQALGIDFSDAWFLVGLTLSRHESLTSSDIAEMLGVSRPAVSQMASAMAKRGLIEVRTDDHDRRRKCLTLSKKGRKIVDSLRPIWEMVGTCAGEVIEESGYDMMGAISAFEKGHEEKSIYDRVMKRMADRTAGG
jgi:DNA-binding MarR family transcriptional regulator